MKVSYQGQTTTARQATKCRAADDLAYSASHVVTVGLR